MSDSLGTNIYDLRQMLSASETLAEIRLSEADTIQVILTDEDGASYKIQEVNFDSESKLIEIVFDHDNE